MKLRLGAGWAACALIAACRPPEPRPIELPSTLTPLPGVSLAPERASVIASWLFAFDDIPRFVERAEPSADTLPLELVPNSGGFRLQLGKDFLAELTTEWSRLPVDGPAAAVIRYESNVRCGTLGGAAGRSVSWEGIDVGTWTADSAEYVAYAGSFDHCSCRGTATRYGQATAVAIIPRVLYSFRRSSGGGAEEIVFVGPPSRWIATTGDDPAPMDQGFSAFTRLALPVRRGSAASAELRVERADLGSFVRRGAGGGGAGHDQGGGVDPVSVASTSRGTPPPKRPT